MKGRQKKDKRIWDIEVENEREKVDGWTTYPWSFTGVVTGEPVVVFTVRQSTDFGNTDARNLRPLLPSPDDTTDAVTVDVDVIPSRTFENKWDVVSLNWLWAVLPYTCPLLNPFGISS